MSRRPYEPTGLHAMVREAEFRSKSVQRRLAISRKESPMVVTMVEQLRNVDIDRAQIADVMALSAFAKSLRAEYEARQYEVPAWIDDKLRIMGRYIEMHKRDNLERRLTEARAQQAALMTPTEKREKLAADIAAMEAELNATK